MICKECKAEISTNVCPCCGYKNTSKKKKTIILISILTIVIVAVASAFFVLYNINKKMDVKKRIDACVENGENLVELLNASKNNMEIIGMFYSSSTKMNYGYSWDEEYFTNYVTDLNSTEISKEKTNRTNIKVQYEKIKGLEYDSEWGDDFKKQTDNLYNAYEDMYDLLIEQNFTYKNFETKYTQNLNELNMALELYNDVIKELNTNE